MSSALGAPGFIYRYAAVVNGLDTSPYTVQPSKRDRSFAEVVVDQTYDPVPGR
jgi:hypothetical protein